MEIEYIGEHLWPGRIGHLAVVVSFFTSLLAFGAYALATATRDDETRSNNWRRIGRGAFALHGLSTMAIIGVLFFIMSNQYYEYQYVWANVSDSLPYRYIATAFWQAQQGSFLLWGFWHIVLGLVVMIKGGKWEAPVLSILSLIQAFIISMLLGVYLTETFQLGVTPMALLRETMNAPIFNVADYVERISGKGMNPLLQNYWMIIHPPTLFLGFASTSIPFCFAIAGLWTKDHKGWLQPALPWALFTGSILGIGILMGAAWAYEALSFGGYWAWDPVENMSLVPWILLVAGIHTNLVARSTGHSIRATYLFYLATFVFIVYSTFLTRSGVLGDTSVHAFTEMGLEWQLVGFVGTFALLGAAFFAARAKGIPAPVKEEKTSSKEFWMFIGSLVLLFSAVMITVSTSLPVYNKIGTFFNPDFEHLVINDQEAHHNKFQLWVGIFIAGLTGMAQALRWREFNFGGYAKKYFTHTGVQLGVTALLTFLTSLWIDFDAFRYGLLVFLGIYAVVANLDYLISFSKNNVKGAGSVLSHVGFGLLMVGVIATGLNKQHISTNPFANRNILPEAWLGENVMLEQGKPIFMSGYLAEYTTDTLIGNERTFTIEYEKVDSSLTQVTERFTVAPTATYDNEVKKIMTFHPDTRHYLSRDIFTRVAALSDVEMDEANRHAREDTLNFRPVPLQLGQPQLFTDTSYRKERRLIRDYEMTVLELDRNPTHEEYEPERGDLALGAKIRIKFPQSDEEVIAEPVMAMRGNLLYNFDEQVDEFGMRIQLTEAAFDAAFVLEEELDYQEFTLQAGETFEVQGIPVQFVGFNKEVAHPAYVAEEGDVAVAATFRATGPDGRFYTAEPVYLIRGNRPYNLKTEIDELGLHLRFLQLDPSTGSVQIAAAYYQNEAPLVPLEVATNSPRTDWLVLETIIFPGINLVWLGSILMMLGLGLASWYRWRHGRPVGRVQRV